MIIRTELEPKKEEYHNPPEPWELPKSRRYAFCKVYAFAYYGESGLLDSIHRNGLHSKMILACCALLQQGINKVRLPATKVPDAFKSVAIEFFACLVGVLGNQQHNIIEGEETQREIIIMEIEG